MPQNQHHHWIGFLAAAVVLAGIGVAHSADIPIRAEVNEETPRPGANLPTTPTSAPTTEPANPNADRIDYRLIDGFGLRPKLADVGVTVETNWIIDYSKNLRGGANTEGDTVRNLFDLRVNLDTAAAFKWDGGTFSFDFQNHAGANGSDDLGDIQGFDNIDSDGRTQINEVWYQQDLFDKKLRVKVGKVDTNSEFAAPENSGEFIGSSYGHSPTTLAMPTYPDPSTSVNLFVYPTEHTYAGVGVYDGSTQSGNTTGTYGPSRIWHSGASFFYIGEVGCRWACNHQTLPGKFAIGAHYHDGDFEKFNGGTQSGAGGMYAILDQKLWTSHPDSKDDTTGVFAFAQYGHADGDVSEITDHLGVGVTWVGPYDKENPDTIGLGISSVRLTDKSGAGFTEDYETAIEAFYLYPITSYLSVKPDLQYIVHPGGDASLDDALVATIRLTLSF